jgi:hypothetical protein
MNSYPSAPRTGLAVASLVLGILSLLCLGLLGGIPAVICGHVARGRAQRSPQEYGGAGMALTGLMLGYLSIVTTLAIVVTLAFYLGAVSQALSGGGTGKGPANPVAVVVQAKQQTEEIVCANNLKQIGLAFRIWSTDNGDKFPFNVSTNQGGMLELCDRRPDGFEKYPAVHFQALSAELMFPAILRCPADRNTQPAPSFQALQATNVTYQLRSGPDLDETATDEILCLCPVHSLVLRADGSVMPGR